MGTHENYLDKVEKLIKLLKPTDWYQTGSDLELILAAEAMLLQLQQRNDGRVLGGEEVTDDQLDRIEQQVRDELDGQAKDKKLPIHESISTMHRKLSLLSGLLTLLPLLCNEIRYQRKVLGGLSNDHEGVEAYNRGHDDGWNAAIDCVNESVLQAIKGAPSPHTSAILGLSAAILKLKRADK